MNSNNQIFFQTGGSLSADFPTYITRKADYDLYKFLKEGRFCYVLTARQMGKSSLRVHVMDRLRKEDGILCVFIDITKIGNKNSTVDQWYYSILYEISKCISFQAQLYEWWKERSALTPVLRFAEFFETVCLNTTKQKIVVFIDEIDAMLDLDKNLFSTDDFFAVIRSFYNSRVDKPEMNKLTFAFFGVATPNDLMRDSSRTPFNIGESINLQNFTYEDSKLLLRGFAHLKTDKEALLREILYWTNGHPYLTQKLCYSIVSFPESDVSIKTMIKNRVTELFLSTEAHGEPNLSNVNNRILNNNAFNAEMLDICRQLISGKSVKSNDTDFTQIYLKLSGLVVAQEGKLHIDNRIYKSYFNEAWIKAAFNKIDRPFSEALQRWIKLNKSKDAALRGSALEDFSKWSSGRNDLTQLEHEFLEFSRVVQQKQTENAKKQLWSVITILTILIILSMAFGIFALYQKNKATRLAVKSEKLAQMAEMEKSAAIDAKEKLAIEKSKADFISMEAQRLKELAERKSIIATIQKRKAEKNEEIAKQQKELADEAALWARTQQELAEIAFRDYRKQKEATDSAVAVSEVLIAQVTEKNQIIDVQPYLTRARDALRLNSNVALRIAEHAFRLQEIDSTEMLLYKIIGDPKIIFYSRSFGNKDDELLFATFLLNQNNILTISRNSSLKTWDIESQRILSRSVLSDKEQEIAKFYCFSLSPDNQKIATIDFDYKLKIWNVSNGKLIVQISPVSQRRRLPTDKSRWCEYSPDGRKIAIAFDDFTTKLYDTDSSKLIKSLKGYSGFIKNVSFSSDGRQIVTNSSDGTIGIWDTESGRQINSMEGYSNLIQSAFFSNDNNSIIISSLEPENPALIWNLSSNRIQDGFAFDKQSDGTYAIFSPDDRNICINYFVTETLSSFEVIWNIQSKQQIAVLRGHSGVITYMKYSKDGTKLLTVATDGTAKIWNLQYSPIRSKIIDAYKKQVPFENVKDLIDQYLKSGDVPQLTRDQMLQYGIPVENPNMNEP